MDINAHIKGLNEARLRSWEAQKAELDLTAGRERTAEETVRIERMDAEIDRLDAELRQFVQREQRERESASLRESAMSLIGAERVEARDAREDASLRSWLESGAKGDFAVDIRGAMKERQALRAGASAEEIRAIAWDASSGSLVVPTTMARSLYEFLEASIAAFRIGAMQMNTSTGENIQLPRLLTHSIGTQVSAQNVTIGGADATFAQTALNVFKYGNLTQVASELVSDSAFDIAAWLGRDLGYALGRIIDADLIIGTGTNEPTGMAVLAGAGTNAPVTTGGSLIAPTVEKYIDTVYSVNDGARSNGAAWLMRDAVAGTVRKLRDGAGGTVGAFLWQPSLTQGIITGQPDRFLGYPVFTDPNMATAGSNATLAVFGDFSEYVVRTVGNPVIERDDSVYFAADAIGFRGKWRVGGAHTAKGHLNTLVQNV
tara:strand:- start:63 stop:1352 length:1290 start_codon:yes stop_codon:yes gene_type:complete